MATISAVARVPPPLPPRRAQEETLTDGTTISHEELWLLVRRFNKQVSHVKALPCARGQRLDLHRAAEEQYPQAKLQITIERFYTSVIVKIAKAFNHFSRLRSWKEPRRTGIFCAVYFTAWLLNILSLVIVGGLVAVAFYPPIRPTLFPPIPASEVEVVAKGVDSTPPGSQAYDGETEEFDMSSVLDEFNGVSTESPGENANKPADENEPINLLEADGENVGEALPEVELQQPRRRAIDQTMKMISNITDIFEKFSNLLSPQPPFYLAEPRLQLAGILLSVCLGSLLLSNHAIAKGCTFMLGLGLFGDPVFRHVVDFLNENVPNWKDHLDMEKTLLAGAPTNAQLTLTLLRMGETDSNPLTPPPKSRGNQPSWLVRRIKSKFGSLTEREKEAETSGTKPRRRWIKVLKFVRRAITTAIEGHVAFDRAMAIAASTNAKGLMKMLTGDSWSPFAPLGLTMFEAKYERKRGTVVIDSSPEHPVIYFSTYNAAKLGNLRVEMQKASSVIFQIPVTEIRELKKTEGLGWKGKLIVELAAGSKESSNGLVIQGIEPDKTYHLTGIKARNQLFNRLVAIGEQFWEIH